ncbi:MAG: cell surface protein, partial [Actinomycetota bacterium]
AFAFGRSTDTPIVGDWDGDGDDEPGVHRGNVWYLADQAPPGSVTAFAFGRSTDTPIVGDWDGP